MGICEFSKLRDRRMTNWINQVSAAVGIAIVFSHRRFCVFSGARQVLAGVTLSTVFT
jgi:hypothetical protein